MTEKEIIDFIYNTRAGQTISLEELGLKAGVGESTLSKIERGKVHTRLNTAINLLDALGYELEIRERVK